MALIATTILDRPRAVDALLDARHQIVAVQSSCLPGQELFERLQLALVSLDDGLALVRS